jgi:choice-of-anchor A domain-containing protein
LFSFRLALLSPILIAGLSSPAGAVTATGLLTDYNLIVFGDATSSSDVDGKAFIGGNLTGGSFDGHNVSAGPGINALTVGGSVFGSVTVNGPGVAIGGNLATSNYNGNGGGNAFVGGNWSGSANFNLNGSGNVYLGGTKTGSGNVNGGALLQNQTSSFFTSNVPTTATVNSVENTLKSYSGFLAGLSSNSNIQISGNTATFNASPNSKGVAVFDITNAQTFFTAISQIVFDTNGAKELIVDVSGAGTNLDIAANFLGGQASSLATDAVWNFTDATKLTVGSQFGGDLLAVDAAVTLSGNEEGTLVAASLTQNAEVHYDGANTNLLSQTPLPATLPLFAAGLGLLGFIALRKKRMAATISI